MKTNQPISLAQSKLYQHAKWYPKDPSYNLTFLFQFSIDLDKSCLCEAIEKVLNAHEVFKVNFEEQGESAVMLYDSERKFSVRQIDLQDVPIEEQAAFVNSFADGKFSEAMDINKWPLCQIYLFSGTKNHFVFICIHHIISDVFTAYQFFEKTSALYNFMKRGGEQPVVEGASYFEAINQMAKVNTQTIEEKYFEQTALECRRIETCFPAERTESGIIKGASTSFQIKDSRIDEYAKSNHISIYGFFVLIHSIFIMKVNKTNKAKIGIPLANRKRAYKDAFGYFVNVLPLALSFDTVADAQREITKSIYRLLRCQSYDVLLSPHREALATDNVITYYKKALAFSLNGTTCRSIPQTPRHLKYPFSMTVENVEADNYRITIEYSDYFSDIPLEDTIINIMNQVLKGRQSLRDIHLLSDTEQRNIWSKLNRKEKVGEKLGDNIATALEKSLKEFPERIALEDSDSSWTYSKLDEYSNRVSAFLSSYSEQNVVVSIPKSKEFIGLLTGVMKAGKTYIPIDIEIPNERKTAILSQLENTVILTDENRKYEYEGSGHRMVDYKEIEDFQGWGKNQGFSSDSAYIIFTSGSTGMPKGVVVSHRNALQYFEAINQEYHFSYKDTWTLFHSVGFDYSIMEIFGALLFGGKLLIVPHSICLAPRDFYEFIMNHKATVLTQTPTYFVNLLDEALKADNNFGHVRYIFSGGEAAQFSLYKPFLNKFQYGDFPKLYNVYGVTETTIISTFHTITMDDLKKGNNNLIGRPYSGISCYVGDSNDDLMPIGIPGELIIAGESVARGYYKNPKETERVFRRVTNDDLNLLDTPVYHTGDLVVMQANGELKYLDRIDHQVQIRGFRVELGEIETAVMQLDSVKDCIALYRKFSDNDMRLIVYVIKDSAHMLLSNGRILDYLKKKLPYYMVPSFIVEIESKPLTMNGKVDKEKLPMPYEQIKEYEEDLDRLDNVANILLNIWKEVLNNPNVTVSDNFFDAGGTSINLPGLYYKILNAFNIAEMQLSMIDIFEFSTIEVLSEHIRAIKEVHR